MTAIREWLTDTPFNVSDLRAPEPTMSLEEIDPETAAQMLSRNTKNRNLKSTKIRSYARDMAAGNWRLTGEAIKFSERGDLLDGQNRLHAVIAANTTVRMFVARGIAENAQEVMDTGAARTGADALSIRGYSAAKDTAATASVYILLRNGYYRNCMIQSNATERPTHAELIKVIEEVPSLVDSAMFAKSITKKSLPLPVGALAVAHHCFVQIDPTTTSELFDSIVNLRTRGKGDPVHTLLKRVGESRDRRERIWASTALFFMFRTWNAVRRDEDIAKFQLGSEGRGWAPIPKLI